MKKLLRLCGFLLIAAMMLSAGFSAGAVTALRSNQGLKVDGQSMSIEPYNVNNYNYFKLRDVAMLLSGTAAQFSVDYDAARNAAMIETGKPYVPIGGELTQGGESRREAVVSPQTVYINGRKTDRLSVYNIGGYNYFKLRDLGEALGFGVDYDETSRTMLLSTGPSLPDNWAPEIVFTTTDADGAEWTEACFAGAKVTMLNSWAYWCGPCVGELPDLQRLAQDYADKGLQLLGVTDREDFELSVAKMEELGVTYPCLIADRALAEATYTGYVPTTIFVDQNGKILDEAYVGSRSYDAWARIIEGYLG